jgi:hypothetical protein
MFCSKEHFYIRQYPNFVGVNRDFTDSLLIARQEAENEGDEAALEKLDDTYLIMTTLDIFFGNVHFYNGNN